MLTDTKIRNLKKKKKLYRIADSHGLTLEINPNGSKLWRHRYRFNNRATMMSLGPYPLVSLFEARQARNKNKQMLLKGINPKQAKMELNPPPSFSLVYGASINTWSFLFGRDLLDLLISLES